MSGVSVTVAPAAPAERVVARLRGHGRALILPVLLLIATAGAAAYSIGLVAEPWQQFAVAGVGLAIVLLGSGLPFLLWLTRRTTVTTRRIILRHGVFVQVRRELLHSRGYDVAVRRTWLQRAFGSGDLHINTGHEQPFVIRDVPKPLLLQAALHELMEESHSLVADRRRAALSAPDGDTVAWGSR
ncbi:PH domain-containing protein [Agromyces tardus]|uniref:PH domain-containing protein n=1 Tax=Agromyces tardus TaxID=2583849 RepID=A0A3M8AN20_9MICO|nr:PH domain-containing protein [Agromyces tardus]RNB52483.1 PH domain-containing protein [Agromyces tardus]